MSEYYDILGVSKDASEADMKKAFRKKAMQYHPDKNKGDAAAEKKFKELNEAYETLKDPQKRAAYDRFGKEGMQGMGGGFSDAFGDIFEEMFGGGGRGQRGGQREQGMRGSDLRYNLEMTLEEAFRGKDETLKYPSLSECEACDGSGAEPGSQKTTCHTCGGSGRVRAQAGFFAVERTCPTCQGEGELIEKPCKACRGQGRVRQDKTVEVSIPKGVEDGTRIRVTGEGEAGVRGGSNGDLYVFIQLKQHDFFEREGADLYSVVPIPFTTAALGGEIHLPAIDGKKLKFTIPEGTQSGKMFRLRSKGMPYLRRESRGDLHVQAQVEIPTNLNKKQKELLAEFAETIGENNKCQPKSDSFFGKVRDLWDDLTE